MREPERRALAVLAASNAFRAPEGQVRPLVGESALERLQDRGYVLRECHYSGAPGRPSIHYVATPRGRATIARYLHRQGDRIHV